MSRAQTCEGDSEAMEQRCPQKLMPGTCLVDRDRNQGSQSSSCQHMALQGESEAKAGPDEEKAKTV